MEVAVSVLTFACTHLGKQTQNKIKIKKVWAKVVSVAARSLCNRCGTAASSHYVQSPSNGPSHPSAIGSLWRTTLPPLANHVLHAERTSSDQECQVEEEGGQNSNNGICMSLELNHGVGSTGQASHCC